jgi:hypothetical protein
MKNDRCACDEYCPQESCVICGLPELSEVRLGLQSKPQKIWACHSNPAIPCVATGLNAFPEGSIRFVCSILGYTMKQGITPDELYTWLSRV